MDKIERKIQQFEKQKETNLNQELLTKDPSSSRVINSPEMGSQNWQPTKPTHEKPFMTATIMSSEKVRSRSPAKNNQTAINLLKSSDNNRDLKSNKSKSPIVDRGQQKNEKQQMKSSNIDRLAQPKNRTEP